MTESRVSEFSGEVADFYDAHRRGYPETLPALLTALTPPGPAFDIGCGTGQLTLPLADCGWTVVGVDPSADMLAHARRRAAGRKGVTFVIGTDADLPALVEQHGSPTLITVATALHLMDFPALVRNAAAALPPGGVLAVVSNGVPPWQQDSSAAHHLRALLQDWFGRPLTATCGTTAAEHDAVGTLLKGSGFAVRQWSQPYRSELAAADLIGLLYSAMSPDQLPQGEKRAAFSTVLRRAVGDHFEDAGEVRATIATRAG